MRRRGVRGVAENTQISGDLDQTCVGVGGKMTKRKKEKAEEKGG
jgi:hypothetical protein